MFVYRGEYAIKQFSNLHRYLCCCSKGCFSSAFSIATMTTISCMLFNFCKMYCYESLMLWMKASAKYQEHYITLHFKSNWSSFKLCNTTQNAKSSNKNKLQGKEKLYHLINLFISLLQVLRRTSWRPWRSWTITSTVPCPMRSMQTAWRTRGPPHASSWTAMSWPWQTATCCPSCT